jgi:hypothetical protein
VDCWSPQYLEAKRETLCRFHGHRILVAVAEASLRVGAAIREGFLAYKTALKLEPALEALERMCSDPAALKRREPSASHRHDLRACVGPRRADASRASTWGLMAAPGAGQVLYQGSATVRTAAAIAAELTSMEVTEQVDGRRGRGAPAQPAQRPTDKAAVFLIPWTGTATECPSGALSA